MGAYPAQYFKPIQLRQLEIEQHHARQFHVFMMQIVQCLYAIVKRLDASDVVSPVGKSQPKRKRGSRASMYGAVQNYIVHIGQYYQLL